MGCASNFVPVLCEELALVFGRTGRRQLQQRYSLTYYGDILVGSSNRGSQEAGEDDVVSIESGRMPMWRVNRYTVEVPGVAEFTGVVAPQQAAQPQNPAKDRGPCEIMALNAQNEAYMALEKTNFNYQDALYVFDSTFSRLYLGVNEQGHGRTMRKFSDVLRYARGGATDNREVASTEANKKYFLGQSDFKS